MGYTWELLHRRYAERTDLSMYLVHLTREGPNNNQGISNLYKILESGKLIGSNTTQGFIIGSTPAVCLQDIPLTSVCQNCWFDQKYRKKNKDARERYSPIGLMIPKSNVFAHGGRPVIYDQKEVAKSYLSQENWWRIVNFDLSNGDNIIDWTHEREWRVPNELPLNLSNLILLFTSEGNTQEFIELCDSKNTSYYKQVGGFVTLTSLLW